MDRAIVTALATPDVEDLLYSNRFPYVAIGRLCQALFGPGPLFNGLTCTPGTGLTVSVGVGEVYVTEALDPTNYGTLPADTTHTIVKQGILFDPAVLACPAPSTAGQSIAYLVEAQFQEADNGTLVLPFYDSANPEVPYSGPNNTGAASPTKRSDICAVQIKAGTAATIGSQAIPTVDAGWTALYVVTVANGATTISNIAVASGAPFLTEDLLAKISAATAQAGAFSYSADTGSANALAAVLSPAPTLGSGLSVRIKVAAANTGASTLALNGLAAKPVVNVDGSALAPGQLVAGGVATLVYDGASFQLQSIAGSHSGLHQQTSIGPGTSSFTVPVGVYNIKLRLWGGGGGGGASTAAGASGSGGGGGGYAEGYFAVTPGEVLTVNVGSGGAAGTTGNGAAGGNTSITGTGIAVSANGGGAGQFSASGGQLSTGTGGAATGGTLNVPGQNGGDGIAVGGTGLSGAGGNAFASAGAPVTAGGGSGGSFPAGGGSGGANNNTAGGGQIGVAIIEY